MVQCSILSYNAFSVSRWWIFWDIAADLQLLSTVELKSRVFDLVPRIKDWDHQVRLIFVQPITTWMMRSILSPYQPLMANMHRGGPHKVLCTSRNYLRFYNITAHTSVSDLWIGAPNVGPIWTKDANWSSIFRLFGRFRPIKNRV